MDSQSTINRRGFTKNTLAISGAIAAAPSLTALGANDKIRLGFIGLGGRGQHHFRQFLDFKDVEIVSLCDVDQENTDACKERLGKPAQVTQHFEDVLDNPDVDAVVIATTDHWHAIPAILAMKAGKDVYCEKPMGHSVEEQQRMIEAVKKTGRIMQIGLQQRSSKQFQQAVEWVKSGEIGKVTGAECINMWNVDGYLNKPPFQPIIQDDEAAPPTVDYERFLGPAPKLKFNRSRFRNSFYFHNDYAGGMLTGWGVHLFDIVVWALGHEMNSITTIGGKFYFEDMRDTPDTADCLFECPGYNFKYSLRHANGFPHDPELSGIDHGIYFYGSKATILVNRQHAKLYPENDRKNPIIIPAEGGDIEHKQNFLDCVRSRKKPAADVYVGHYANLPGLLGIISYRLGRQIRWNPERETIINDREASSLLKKKYRKPYALPDV